jgi:xylitol oxidase
VGSRRGEELLARYERDLADLGVRPHWGQLNALTPERVRALYPRWDAWLAAAARFNHSRVFDSPFTQRIGIAP